MKSPEELRNQIKSAGLKITPQRVAILEAVVALNNHPTTEHIQTHLRDSHPNIALGTIYKILETFVETGILRRVKTDKDSMRYDAILTPHHHVYCSNCDSIIDYEDGELDELLKNYFAEKGIPGFQIEEIKLQITGRHDEQA
jgi:Fur family transcriptional regulator, peroxide stress response regulator